MMTVVFAAEETRELPVPPLVVGLVAFGILVLMLGVTLSYGKGRPHS